MEILSKLDCIDVLETYIQNGILLVRPFNYTRSDVKNAIKSKVEYKAVFQSRQEQHSIYQEFKKITDTPCDYQYLVFQLHNLLAPVYGMDLFKEVKAVRNPTAKIDANFWLTFNEDVTSKIEFLDDILDEIEEREALTAEQPAPMATTMEPKEPTKKQKKALDELAKLLSEPNVVVQWAIEQAAKKADYKKDNVWKLHGKVKRGELIHKKLAVIIGTRNESD